MPLDVFSVIYTLAIIGLSIYGVQSLALAVIFLIQKRRQGAPPPAPAEWPPVTVQLPIYNEKLVVERLIDAACALDYPRDRLTIQVLDDSTDGTLEISRRRAACHREQGVQIEVLHRARREGFKAGALAAGLAAAPGELVAIFDADFVPPPDFLKRLVPYLAADPRLGMVQARWGHLNADYSLLTRAQALFLDGHFVIEQATRCRSGLLFNFNGSAGIWRRECIADAGGWQGDTLSEDLDLSYRAQLKGWRFAFVPEVVAPAEIPPQVAALKQQQYRWARGSIQVLIKLFKPVSSSRLTFWQRVAGILHLSAYLAHPLMMALLLACLPVILLKGRGLPAFGWLSLVGFGPPLLFALSQWAVYPDWRRRLLYFPVLMGMGIGMGFNNTRAVAAALRRAPINFVRTPKFHLESRQDQWARKPYAIPVDWTTWVELALAVYALATGALAWQSYRPLAPMLALFTLGFGYVGLTGLWQGLGLPQGRRKELRDANRA